MTTAILFDPHRHRSTTFELQRIRSEEFPKKCLVPPESKYEQEVKALLSHKFIRPVVKAFDLQENELNKKLPEVAARTVIDLRRDPDALHDVSDEFRDKINDVVIYYKYANEDFSVKLDKWVEQRRKNIQNMQRSIQVFRIIKKSTSAMSIISSVVEVATVIGNFYNVSLPYWSPSVFLWGVGSVNVVGSILALTYSKQTVEDILRGLREEQYYIRDLVAADRKGNAADDDVDDLFPHGIMIELIEEMAAEESFMQERNWKPVLYFAIILPNIYKDKKLINDGKFLASVKAFVDSPAARMWINR